MDGENWWEKEADGESVAAHMANGHDAVTARLLAVRDIPPGETEAFFNPVSCPIAPPDTLPGANAAAEKILSHIESRNKIVVFGDYDCDGICATAILCKTIEMLGGEAASFLPHRITEGYGMTVASLERFKCEHPGVKLVVTVDNGINSAEMAAELAANGIELVVTDHHLPGETLPDCIVVDPHVASAPGQKWLCGAGVAFTVANAMVDLAKERGLYKGGRFGAELLVLAGIATVSDLMPLTGQNRVIVARALKMFDAHAPAGIKALYDRAARRGVEKHISRDFGFIIGPRLNACGRVGSADAALALVRENDHDAARKLAAVVEANNARRQSEEKAMTELALSKVVRGAAAQAIELPGGSGVAGIVAARVLDALRNTPGERAVPVCVVVDGKGSARAPDGYNVREALAGCGDALERCGGHAAAAGVTVREGMMDEFRRRFAAECARQASTLPPQAFSPPAIDAWLEWNDIDMALAANVERFEPFGEGNPQPVFALRNAMFSELRTFGTGDARHLLISFAGPRRPRAVWWGRGAMAGELRGRIAIPHDIMFNILTSDFGGEKHIELRIVAIRESV